MQGRLDGVRQSSLDAGLYDQPVHDDLDIVLEVLVQVDLLGKLVHAAVDAGPDIAGTPGLLQELRMLTLPAPHHRRHELDPAALRQLHDRIHHLVHGLALDLPAAAGAVGNADPGVEKAQIVVDLRYGAHRRPGVMVRALLVDADGRRQPFDALHLRFFHLAQELSGIAGERLHVASLSLRIDGVKGQRGFSGTGKSRKHHQLVPGDVHIDIF